MSLVEDVFKGGNLAAGVGLAIGVAVAGPVLIPIVRGLAKTVLKAGMIAFDQGRVAYSELSATTSAMVAEAREEMDGDDDTAGTRRGRRRAAAA